jgi:hypothetical protein
MINNNKANMVNKKYYSIMTYNSFFEKMSLAGYQTQQSIADKLNLSQGTISLWKSKNSIPNHIEKEVKEIIEIEKEEAKKKEAK